MRCSAPTCEMRPGKTYFTTEPPGGFRYCTSKESVSGTSSVIRLPSIAAITRSVLMSEPAEIHAWGWPLRTSVSIPSPWIQAAVTGRRTRTVSPTAKPEASLTLNDVAPERTYESVMAAGVPTVCHDPAPEILRKRKGMLITVSARPEPLPPALHKTTPLAAMLIVALTL